MILAVFAGCKQQDTTAKDDVNKADSTVAVVNVLQLKKHSVAQTVEYYSSVVAFEDVNLAPASPGRIEKIFVETGDHVSAGDLLVQMDRTQLHQAEVQLANLKTDFERFDTLRKAGGIAEQKFDQVKTQYEVAKANVAFLKENTRLEAPFSGIVSGKYFEDGEVYSGAPNTAVGKPAILSIVQIDPVKALVNIPESYYPELKKGDQTNVLCDTYPDEHFSGHIYRIHPTIDPATRSFVVEVEIPNPSLQLRPGMFCRIMVNFGKKEALTVPAIAVLKLQGSNERYVFLEKNGRAKRVTVKMGKRFDDQVELISDEIKAGDMLIVSGQSKLLDGDPVKVVASN